MTITRTGLLGILVALLIGAIVRLLKLPIPSPPTLESALMVVGLTVGWLGMGYLLEWLKR